ncbi:MAG: family 43 glycosylhydrolase [Muribaculaceae bacterium]|nr:family 43 glycosylhydrolase [Muribaculaceae bacterium]
MDGATVKAKARYLWPDDYMADPAAHVFNGKIYIYPSHDWDSPVTDGTDGNHFDMRDYHVLSIDGDPMTGKVTDHGCVMSLEQVPWAERQLWATDCVERDGIYYLYFTARAKDGLFKIGVATATAPEGPFTPQAEPIAGTYSIDPAVFNHDGNFYIYFGGLGGGQLQNYPDNEFIADRDRPAKGETAMMPRVARLSDDMLSLAEAPRPLEIVDAEGQPLAEGNPHRFYEASWMHENDGRLYFSYSTGDSHLLCYAIGDSPYGPFTYTGEIMTPVKGWTTHHSIVNHDGDWWIFYHDSANSGKSRLRSTKVSPLTHRPDGTIVTIAGQ